jgi:hypothetical protein
MRSLLDKYRIFIHEQISYQKYVIQREEERGNGSAADSAHYRIHVYEELIKDLDQAGNSPQRRKEERFKTSPSNKAILLSLLATNGGSATFPEIKAKAVEAGRDQRSMEQMALKLVRDGKLSRTGNKVTLLKEEA